MPYINLYLWTSVKGSKNGKMKLKIKKIIFSHILKKIPACLLQFILLDCGAITYIGIKDIKDMTIAKGHGGNGKWNYILGFL